jgi:hypothetical protein
MHRERDILTRSVFPRLRERFLSRGVALFEVDLRWGITRELAEAQGALRLCLEEVDACRPLFFCMLGENCGSRPSPEELQTLSAAWLAAFQPFTAPSMTEMEIRHALASRGAQGIDPIFFLRDRSLSQRLSAPPSNDSQSMDSLKTFVRQQGGHSIHEYADLAVFEREAETALGTALEAWLRKGAPSAASPQGSVDRPEYTAALERATAKSRTAIVTGPPGCGISWLGERWANQNDRPDQDVEQAISIDGRLTKPGSLATALREARVGRGFVSAVRPGEPLFLDDEVQALCADVERLKLRRLRVFVDHFEEAQASELRADLSAFPQRLPRGLQILVSTRSERAIEVAREADWNVVRVGALDPQTAIAVVEGYLQPFGKHLTPNQLAQLTHAELASNLGSLVLCLNELRRYGKFEGMDARVSGFASLRSNDAIAETVLAGLRSNMPEGYESAVDAVLIALVSSLRGLEETELCAAAGLPSRDPLPTRVWATIRAGLGHSLLWRGARVDLASEPVRRAGRRLMESNSNLASAVCDALLAHLHKTNRARWIEEAFNSTLATRGEGGLVALLTQIDSAAELVRRFPIYANGWFDLLTEEARKRVFAAWEQQLPAAADREELAWDLGYQAAQARALDSAQRLWAVCGDARQNTPDRLLLQALLLKDPTRAKALESLLPQAVPNRPRFFEATAPVESTPSGDVQDASQRWARAAGMLALAAEGLIALSDDREALWIAEARACSTQAQSAAVSAQALILIGQLQLTRARWREAEASFDAACKYARRCGHARFLATALERGAVAELELSRFSRARKAATECLEIARECGLFDQECLAFERLIEIERRRANWQEAFELATRYLTRAREVGKNTTRAESCLKSL